MDRFVPPFFLKIRVKFFKLTIFHDLGLSSNVLCSCVLQFIIYSVLSQVLLRFHGLTQTCYLVSNSGFLRNYSNPKLFHHINFKTQV